MSRSSKYRKIGPYGLGAALLITMGVALRLILIGNGWPLTNSDEATMGIHALHILNRGELPIFQYGINYMGTIEPYLGSFFFRLFGPSTFALRLSLVVMYAGFLVALYLLARLLYTKGVALAALFLLCWGSSDTLFEQLTATGGRLETQLFGTLSLLLASWLALSFHPNISSREQRKRLVAYGCLGGVIGLGLWSHMLVLPFVGTSLLLLLLFCRCELCNRLNRGVPQASLFGVLGFLIGAFPLLLFNIQHPQDNSLVTLWHQYRSAGIPLPTGENLSTSILGAILITIPKATGAHPLCPVSELGQWVHQLSLSCMGFQLYWGLGAIILWTLAMLAVIKELRRHRQALSISGSPAEKEHLVRCTCRLMLLTSAGLTVLSYATSPSAALFPLSSARYLVGLSVVIPAIVAFLWPRCPLGKGALICLVPLGTIVIFSATGYLVGLLVVTLAIITVVWPRLWLRLGKAALTCSVTKWTLAKIVDNIKIGILCFISTILILGMVTTFLQIPDTQKLNQRQNTLINSLLSMHAPHIYSDYWTCYRLIFLSDERIICSVLNTDLSTGWIRYEPYAQIVKHDPHDAYVFDTENGGDGISQDLTFRQRFGAHYHPFYLAGFVIYLPASNIPSAKSRDFFANR